jgi:uncharacterized delta-60 repeat protein
VVAGWSSNGSDLDFGVVRYTSDGTLDTSFDTDGIVVTDISAGDDDYAEALGIRPNGKIVVVGHSIVTQGVTEDFEIAQYE